MSTNALRQGTFTRTNGAPEGGIWPRFFMDTVEDVLATQRAGRPIYTEVERVEYNMPGNPYSKPVLEVTDEQKERWPDQYAAFKRGQEVAVSGTPLEHWPLLKRAQVLELKALGLLTIEHVADMNDHVIQRIAMGGWRLKELAGAFLDDAKAQALLTAATAESDRKDQKIAALELQLENLSTQMQAMHQALMDKLNTPNALMTHVPAASDPMEMMKGVRAPEGAQSSFADLPAPTPRRRHKATEGAT